MKVILLSLVPGLLVGLCLFLAAGRVDVPAFWLYAAFLWGNAAATYGVLGRRSPGLVAERMRPPSDRDRATRLVSMLAMLGHFVVAGLDVGRFGWSAVPLAAQVAGFALVALGFGLVDWTLLSNPFASSAVRIQREREHAVISSGPYALVRHPMYLGVFLVCLGSGPALGSLWASLVLLPVVAAFVRRTAVEDRMLHEELPGYRDYAGRVRWRVAWGIF
jgi:protein-S-isoprenylcysteine O-methyltransferase Ste14